jgi:hypothetical protein
LLSLLQNKGVDVPENLMKFMDSALDIPNFSLSFLNELLLECKVCGSKLLLWCLCLYLLTASRS